MKKRQEGFTLVELIIVIVIIGILAAVLIPQLTSYIEKARRSNDVQKASSMTLELNNYCILNDLNLDEICGMDVQDILEYAGFDLKPATSKWTYYFNTSTNRVEVGDFASDGYLFALDEESKDLTEVTPGKYVIGKGNSNVEKLISEITDAGSFEYFEEIKSSLPAAYVSLIENEYIGHTLFITANGFQTIPNDTVKHVVFLNTNFVPALSVSKIDETVFEESYKIDNKLFLFAVKQTGGNQLATKLNIEVAQEIAIKTLETTLEFTINNVPYSQEEIFYSEGKFKVKKGDSYITIDSSNYPGFLLSKEELQSMRIKYGAAIEQSNLKTTSFAKIGVIKNGNSEINVWCMTILLLNEKTLLGYKEIYYYEMGE